MSNLAIIIPDLICLITIVTIPILIILKLILEFFKFKFKQKPTSDLLLANIGDTNSPGSEFDFLITFLFIKDWSFSSASFNSVTLSGY